MPFIKDELSLFAEDSSEMFSSAVLTNANIIEKVIPGLKAQLKKVSEDRAFVGSDGFPRYADGSIIPNLPRLTGQ